MDRRRVIVFLVALIIPLAGLETRLAYMQVFCKDDFAGPARRSQPELAMDGRARIVDRRGIVLARDARSFDLWLILDEFEKRPEARAELALAGLDEAIERVYQRIDRLMNARPEKERWRIYARERRTPYPVLKGLPFDTAVRIETNLVRFPGCQVREARRRIYPYGPTGALIVGTLGWPSKEEAQRVLDDPRLADFIEEEMRDILARRGAIDEQLVGRTGIERAMNDVLRARPGIVIQERDPATGERTTVDLLPAESGEDVELTIDIEIQKRVEEVLSQQAMRTTAILLEHATGAVVAMGTNAPFDPNHFIPPTNSAALKAYAAEDGPQPLLNRATQRQFQLGSIFKILTAIAALEEKKSTPARAVECRGHFTEAVNRFRCWTVSHGLPPHGMMTVAIALEQSCNCYFYQMGHDLSFEQLSGWAQRVGFGRKTGIEVGEAAGALPRPESHPRWRVSDSYSLAIGQHELAATPLQVARMLAVVANGGKLVKPHLLRGNGSVEDLGISKETLVVVKEGLHLVVHGPHGTAKASGLSKFDIVGKTSSAQTREGQESHAWFGGFTKDLVVVVLVEFGGGGGATAAPVVAKILEALK